MRARIVAWSCTTLLLAVTLASGQLGFGRRFDYALYLRVDSEPRGVDLYGPHDEDEEAVRLGRTPCTIAVGFTWDERFGNKQWKTMNVCSLADAFRAEVVDKETYDLYFKGSASKPGYVTQEIDAKVGTLPYPGFQWDLHNAWSRELKFSVTLVPDVAPPTPRGRTPRPVTEKKTKTRVPTIIVGQGGEGSLAEIGTVGVRANVRRAQVLVDGKVISRAPVDLLLPAGTHTIEVRKSGYASFKTDVEVWAEDTHRVDAELMPGR